MKPFYKAERVPGTTPTLDELCAAHPEVTREEIERQLAQLEREMRDSVIAKNDQYQVVIREIPPTEHGFGAQACLVHLSIKRIDREVIHDWRDLQEIKNHLIGEQCEGFELYPAESRLVDLANQYHLWVFANPAIRMPCGWSTRMVGDATVRKSKQRPRGERRGGEEYERIRNNFMRGAQR
jgi:hypothetical protein